MVQHQKQVDWLLIGYWIRSILFIMIGIVLSTIGLQLFMVPFDIAPTGITGVAVIVNHFFGLPIGAQYMIGNIPIMVLGYRYLGGWRIVLLSVFTIFVYAIVFDASTPYFPPEGISDNALLNALFGGILNGIGTGFVMRAGSTFGGTSTLAQIIQRKTGTPLSTTFLYTDMMVIAAAGFVFGWESALYAIVALFISGVATDYILEGPSVIRTVFIVTDKPRAVSDAILDHLGRGVTAWDTVGMYTEREHSMLYVTIARSQVEELRSVVSDADEKAFIVIGQGHTAYGVGFKRSRPKFVQV